MIFISFPNEFTGEDQIQNLENNWLFDPIERMGILNWMLEGLQRLLCNGRFTESKTQNETQTAFLRHSDPINAFLNEFVDYEKNFAVKRSEFYEGHKDYCEVFGLRVETMPKFTQRILNTKGIYTYRIGRNDRGWRGVKLRSFNDNDEIVKDCILRTERTLLG